MIRPKRHIPAPNRPASYRRGFTLIEVILVMLILSIAAAVAVPTLARFSRGRQSTDAVEHMISVIQYAQDQSAATGFPYRFHVDAKSGTYWIESRRDGVFVRLSNDFGQTFNIPADYTASWDGPKEIATQGYIEFEPDGGHDVAVIKLTDAKGQTTFLGCASPSEAYRIAEPGVQETP